MLQAKQALVDAVKQGLGANTEQLRKVGGLQQGLLQGLLQGVRWLS